MAATGGYLSAAEVPPVATVVDVLADPVTDVSVAELAPPVAAF